MADDTRKEEYEGKINGARLAIHFKVKDPVDLADLSNSFGSVANLYNASLPSKMRPPATVKDASTRLHLSKIENNCIFIELGHILEIANQVASTIDPDATKLEKLNTILNFAKELSATIDNFIKVAVAGSSIVLGFKFSKKLTTDVLNILQTAEKNKQDKLGIKAMRYKKGVFTTEFDIEFSNEELKKAKKGAEIVLEEFKETSTEKKTDVLLRFRQANADKPAREDHTNFRGIIEELGGHNLPVFMSETDSKGIRKGINDKTLNPFAASFRVNVNVKKNRNDKPQSYEITELHEIIPDATP